MLLLGRQEERNAAQKASTLNTQPFKSPCAVQEGQKIPSMEEAQGKAKDTAARAQVKQL